MRLLRGLEELEPACQGGTCLTIGVFDAVHRGHQMLIKRARDQARLRALTSLVFTFERHPLALLAPVYCPPALTQPETKARLIGELGVDLCLLLPFTREIAAVSAEAFIADVLLGLCRAQYVACGWNFSFGEGGKGDTALLRRRGRELGFEVELCDALVHGSSPISSSRIRQLLLDGRVAEAAEMLRRPYGFCGEVVPGSQRGRRIGYPTANLRPPADQLIPADGVYAVQVQGADERRGGMLNIGRRPTFEASGRTIEAHLFDFSGDLLGRRLEVRFLERLRDERKFDSVERLAEQLKQDETAARRICGRPASPGSA